MEEGFLQRVLLLQLLLNAVRQTKNDQLFGLKCPKNAQKKNKQTNKLTKFGLLVFVPL